MPLIYPDTRLSDSALGEIYASQCADLKEFLGDSRKPPVPPVDPLRYDQVRSLLEGSVALLTGWGAPIDRAQTIAAINLSYDILIVATEAWKRALGLPQVPRRRAPT